MDIHNITIDEDLLIASYELHQELLEKNEAFRGVMDHYETILEELGLLEEEEVPLRPGETDMENRLREEIVNGIIAAEPEIGVENAKRYADMIITKYLLGVSYTQSVEGFISGVEEGASA